jgi:hypothetical protein
MVFDVFVFNFVARPIRMSMKGIGPAVKRLLSENPSINILSLKPSFKSGRITKTDILNFLENPKPVPTKTATPTNPRERISFQDVPNSSIPNVRKINPHSFMKTEIPFLPAENIVSIFKSILRRTNKYITFQNNKYIESPREKNLNTLLVTEFATGTNLFLNAPHLFHLNLSTKTSLVEIDKKPTMKKFTQVDFTFDTRILDPSEGAAILNELALDSELSQ